MEKVCKICNKDFVIEKEESLFYEKVKVPFPHKCPECRMKQRLVFRNERTLYRRACDLCKKEVISIYVPKTPFPVYCHDCWWSDKWDPISSQMDYDPSRPFLEQFGELKNKIPRFALLVLNSVNSEYTNNASDNKNCYLIFAAENNEDCAYSRLIMKSKSIFDCASTYESELCYELFDSRNCFKCLYSDRLQDCVEVLFSFDMRNSQNCIFCTNGRNLTYCIENKQYTKEEYEKKKAEIFSSYESIEKAKEKYNEIRGKALVKYALAIKCNNTTGDYIYNCHNGKVLFDTRNAKDSSYMVDAEDPIDCYDCNNTYFKAERCYNIMGTLGSSKTMCSVFPMYCSEVEYSDSCYHCISCFGCAGLNKKNYHILNKEYSKEEYEKTKAQIIESMRNEGVYGDFLPASMSPFGYNETLGQEYFPMTEKEIKEMGFNWQTEHTGTFGKETITEANIPSTINEVTEDILKQVLVCKDCKKNFRITKSEFDFYKRMNLPLPHKDFECRHKDRMSKRNPHKLWPRSCMCELPNHQHGTTKCPNNFETSYSPDRKEIVYCEDCYQQEVS